MSKWMVSAAAAHAVAATAMAQDIVRAEDLGQFAPSLYGSMFVDEDFTQVAGATTCWGACAYRSFSAFLGGEWVELNWITQYGEQHVPRRGVIPDEHTLIIGGAFDAIDGVPFNCVAIWDDGVWRSMGGGLTSFGPHVGVSDMLVDDRPGGRDVYITGVFDRAGGVPALNVARWDGSAWHALGAGLPFSVGEIALYDDGVERSLYAVANFDGFSGGLLRFTDGRWEVVGEFRGAGDFSVAGLEVFDDGSGPKLYVAGNFTEVEGEPMRYLASWDGASWEAVGHEQFEKRLELPQLTVHDFGDGPRLYASGRTNSVIDGVACSIASWDGERWRPFDPPAAPISKLGMKSAFVVRQDEARDELWISGALGDGSLGTVRYYGVSPACAIADCDRSGALDIFDFLCFQNAFAAGDPAADCDEDGALAFLDFLCFQQAFATGCP